LAFSSSFFSVPSENLLRRLTNRHVQSILSYPLFPFRHYRDDSLTSQLTRYATSLFYLKKRKRLDLQSTSGVFIMQSAPPDNAVTYKLVVVGEGGVGKSALTIQVKILIFSLEKIV
jgi:hypothetical protein